MGALFVFRILLVLAAAMLCGGCAIPQTYHATQHRTLSLGPDDLSRHGLALITPSTVTGQEEERQAVAITFTEMLYIHRPDISIRALPQTLSAINRSGLEEQYTHMFEDYNKTGLFKRSSLREVADATGVRYLGQLKLSGFTQGSDGRLSVFGLRIMNTKQARIRLFLQIWDSTDGSIVWEGVDELQHCMDTMVEDAVTLKMVLEMASRHLIDQLPKQQEKTKTLNTSLK
jgi:hypothetical protein